MIRTGLQSPLMGALSCGLAWLAAAQAAANPPQLTWLADYGQALKQADDEHKKLVVYFKPPEKSDSAADFSHRVLEDPVVGSSLRNFVLCKIAADTEIKVAGQPVRLLGHPAFTALGQRPGLAVLDLTSKESSQFMRVVGAYRILAGTTPATADVLQMLEAHVPAEGAASSQVASDLQWHGDYSEAFTEAEKAKKPLLIYFRDDDSARQDRRFEDQTLRDGWVLRRLGRFVLARLPISAETRSEGKKTKLLEHPGFAYMYGRQGVSVVDLANEKAPHYRHVVSAFPFSSTKHYDAQRMATILDLPPGTITQRTLIYAVRTHQEHPASTAGSLSPILAVEAENHSQYQASIDNQGHHNWDSRFQRISAQLPGGLVAQEVCAESWPGQELVDAAEECISSWRQSSGHWGAVRQHQPFFGYDMKLGGRMVWYATGIFGRHSGW